MNQNASDTQCHCIQTESGRKLQLVKVHFIRGPGCLIECNLHCTEKELIDFVSNSSRESIAVKISENYTPWLHDLLGIQVFIARLALIWIYIGHRSNVMLSVLFVHKIHDIHSTIVNWIELSVWFGNIGNKGKSSYIVALCAKPVSTIHTRFHLNSDLTVRSGLFNIRSKCLYEEK